MQENCGQAKTNRSNSWQLKEIALSKSDDAARLASVRAEAHAFRSQGKMLEAISAYTNLLETNAGDIDALLNLGEICLRTERYEEAGTFFEAILSTHRSHREAKAGRQICRLREEYHRLYDYAIANHASEGILAFCEKYKKSHWRYYLRLNQVEALCFHNKAVVDFGCKYGHSFPFIVRAGAIQVTGIEGWPEYLQEGRSFFSPLYHNISILASEEGYIPLQPESTERVLMIEVVSHINPTFLDRVFSEIYRILKKGGTFFIADGNNTANPVRQKTLIPLYAAWENGPDGAKVGEGVVEKCYATLRQEIIRGRHPNLDPEKMRFLAANTSGLFGLYLEKTIDHFVSTGELIQRPYQPGICPTHPYDYGTLMERGFHPEHLAETLRMHGFLSHHVRLKTFDNLSDYARKLSLEEICIPLSEIGANAGFHLIAVKK
jgi:SAM-dependent methyltransferase